MKLHEIFRTVIPYDITLRKPCVIAEAGVNHEGSMDLAKRLIDEAKEGGADAIKFQSYKAESIASKESPAYWDLEKEPTRSQYELFKKYDRFWKKEFEEIKAYCDKADIEFISTPFDLESARYLNDLLDVFKIASSDITNKPFIEYICQFEKPIILSTGASYLYEIMEAVEWIESYGNPLALLHCVLNYPTKDIDANLGMILDLRRNFPDKLIGYSDHTLPGDMKVLEIATILGASILEKHFTHDKTLPGNDHYHAMDLDDLRSFRDNMMRIFDILGSFKVSCLDTEEMSRKHARRSLVAKRLIKKNHRIVKDDLTWKRPAHGICPGEIDSVLSKIALQDIPEDSIIKWNSLK